MSSPSAVVSLKAFGDFVIACHSLRRLTRQGPVILAGAHLRPLALALDVGEAVRFLPTGSSRDVPAAFDVRRRGWIEAVRSLLELRAALAAAQDGARLVFDRIGWREKFIAAAADHLALPDAPNIYSAYETHFANAGYELVPRLSALPATVRSAVIVPASRVAAKTLSAETIRAVREQLIGAGVNTEVVVLEGDAVELPHTTTARQIPRTFESLIDCIRRTELVVSADSLAAHLAEYLGRRCFVVAPQPNIYWLPASCLASGGWTTFQEVLRLSSWLAAAPHGRPGLLNGSSMPGPQG